MRLFKRLPREPQIKPKEIMDELNMGIIPCLNCIKPRERRLKRREFLTLCHFEYYGLPNLNESTMRLYEDYKVWKSMTLSILGPDQTTTPTNNN